MMNNEFPMETEELARPFELFSDSGLFNGRFHQVDKALSVAKYFQSLLRSLVNSDLSNGQFYPPFEILKVNFVRDWSEVHSHILPCAIRCSYF